RGAGPSGRPHRVPGAGSQPRGILALSIQGPERPAPKVLTSSEQDRLLRLLWPAAPAAAAPPPHARRPPPADRTDDGLPRSDGPLWRTLIRPTSPRERP